MAKTFSFFPTLFSGIKSLFALGRLSPNELENMQKKHQALVIDIRTAKEWQGSGIIPQSQPIQFFDEQGRYDLTNWLAQVKQLQTTPEQPIILVCRSSARSDKLGHLLIKEAGITNIYHLSGGIMAWLKANKPLEKYSNP